MLLLCHFKDCSDVVIYTCSNVHVVMYIILVICFCTYVVICTCARCYLSLVSIAIERNDLSTFIWLLFSINDIY